MLPGTEHLLGQLRGMGFQDPAEGQGPTGLYQMNAGGMGMDVMGTAKAISDYDTQYVKNPTGGVFTGPATAMSDQNVKTGLTSLDALREPEDHDWMFQ